MPAEREKNDENIDENIAADGDASKKGSTGSPRKASPNKGDAKKSNGDGGADPLDKVVQLMQEQQFGRAAAQLQKMLKKTPDDPVLLHNLGCVYTEQGNWAEAEETFMAAFEAQKKENKINYATLFGLGTVLTEQGGMGKLMQAEALFRDCLEKAIAQEENGILETYRGFTSLAENLGLQKRWHEAAEAYEQAILMGTRMFGEEHERVLAQSALLARARRLARLQRIMRIGLWGATAAVPIFCVYMWNYVGGPSLSEIFQFLPAGSSTGQGAAGSAELPLQTQAHVEGEL